MVGRVGVYVRVVVVVAVVVGVVVVWWPWWCMLKLRASFMNSDRCGDRKVKK